MATDDNSVDLYLDLEELSDQPSIFNHAANHVKTLYHKLDNQTLLTLYSYYKQGLEGPCNTPKPSWYDLKAKSKWEAWNKLGDMTTEEAQKLYIELVKSVDSNFDEKIDSTTNGHGNRVSLPTNPTVVQQHEMSLVDHVKIGNTAEVTDYVTKNNTAINELDDLGMGLIHWAADGGHVAIMAVLTENGADVNLADGEGQRALHYAASCGHARCVQFLLSNGADRNLVDNEGCKPVDVAGDEDTRQLLL